MKAVFPGLYYGPSPKSKTLNNILDLSPTRDVVFVNLRERTETSHWYQDRIKHPIVEGNGAKLCQKIIELIETKRMIVYIHDTDGHSQCGPIVLGCWFWHKRDSKFDPIEAIKKEHFEFQFCVAREQRDELDVIKKYALSILRWQSFSKKR